MLLWKYLKFIDGTIQKYITHWMIIVDTCTSTVSFKIPQPYLIPRMHIIDAIWRTSRIPMPS